MNSAITLPPVKSELRDRLLKLADFAEISTSDLIAMARQVPGGTRVQVPDRLSAIVLLLGTRNVDIG